MLHCWSLLRSLLTMALILASLCENGRQGTTKSCKCYLPDHPWIAFSFLVVESTPVLLRWIRHRNYWHPPHVWQLVWKVLLISCAANCPISCLCRMVVS